MSMRCRSKTSIFIRYIPMQVSTCVRDRRRGCRKGCASDWAQEEFGNTNLGDLRLTRRLTQMARFLCETSGEYTAGMPKQGKNESGISIFG
ncbi:MAG: hypothetical protein HRU72_05130 [Planctomycetia bacterium]|nr:MAG: hypothetical protein HRU72_05130 [Planctomycetia bacterium]